MQVRAIASNILKQSDNDKLLGKNGFDISLNIIWLLRQNWVIKLTRNI